MHFCVVKTKTLIKVFCVILCAVVLSLPISGKASSQVFFGQNVRLVPVYEVETAEKKVAISFDAAWGADKTEGILELLKEYDCKATFFLVGFWIEKFPDMVKKIAEAGMEIGNHSATHPDMTTISGVQIQQEIATVNKQIEDLTGTKPKVFRCPYGAYNNNVLEELSNQGMLGVQWDVDSLDWKGLSAVEIETRILDRVKNGSIILCHNNSDHILDALTLVLPRLKMLGYEIVSVGNLVHFENYSIDHNGVQHAR